MEELDLEKAARQLEGLSLARVFYQSVRWASPQGWAGPGPHPVSLAVYLEGSCGQRFRVYWADQLHLHHGHGIAIAPARVIDRDLGPVEEVTELPAWTGLVGRRIQSALIHWREVSEALRSSFRILVAVHGDSVRRPDYPQTLELGFDGGAQVFLSAAQLSDGKAVGFANDLLVVFGRAQLEQIGLS
jgi:hypothetical protein